MIRTDIIAHRGGGGHNLDCSTGPWEHSRRAVELSAIAVRDGICDGLEVDVVASQDGDLFVLHPRSLPFYRSPLLQGLSLDCPWGIAGLTSAVVKELRDPQGGSILELRDLFDLLGEAAGCNLLKSSRQLKLYLEVKSSSAVEGLRTFFESSSHTTPKSIEVFLETTNQSWLRQLASVPNHPALCLGLTTEFLFGVSREERRLEDPLPSSYHEGVLDKLDDLVNALGIQSVSPVIHDILPDLVGFVEQRNLTLVVANTFEYESGRDGARKAFSILDSFKSDYPRARFALLTDFPENTGRLRDQLQC
jgi:hypothetical protein